MQKAFHDQTMRRIGEAMVNGTHTREGSIVHKMDYSGRCERPVSVDRVARVEKDRPGSGDINKAVGSALYTTELMPCRKCTACLKRRWLRWRDAACIEFDQASRVWFATLTASAHNHFHDLSMARSIAARRGVEFDKLNEDEKFTYRVRAFGTHVTKFLKRLRKNSKAELRYIIVCERHKSGDPHIHALFFEQDALNQITKRQLENEWHRGFSQWRLAADKGAVAYVTKYLTKDYSTRIRASLKFGSTDRGSIRSHHSESVKERPKGKRELPFPVLPGTQATKGS